MKYTDHSSVIATRPQDYVPGCKSTVNNFTVDKLRPTKMLQQYFIIKVIPQNRFSVLVFKISLFKRLMEVDVLKSNGSPVIHAKK